MRRVISWEVRRVPGGTSSCSIAFGCTAGSFENSGRPAISSGGSSLIAGHALQARAASLAAATALAGDRVAGAEAVLLDELGRDEEVAVGGGVSGFAPPEEGGPAVRSVQGCRGRGRSLLPGVPGIPGQVTTGHEILRWVASALQEVVEHLMADDHLVVRVIAGDGDPGNVADPFPEAHLLADAGLEGSSHRARHTTRCGRRHRATGEQASVLAYHVAYSAGGVIRTAPAGGPFGSRPVQEAATKPQAEGRQDPARERVLGAWSSLHNAR